MHLQVLSSTLITLLLQNVKVSFLVHAFDQPVDSNAFDFRNILRKPHQAQIFSRFLSLLGQSSWSRWVFCSRIPITTSQSLITFYAMKNKCRFFLLYIQTRKLPLFLHFRVPEKGINVGRLGVETHVRLQGILNPGKVSSSKANICHSTRLYPECSFCPMSHGDIIALHITNSSVYDPLWCSIRPKARTCWISLEQESYSHLPDCQPLYA